MNIHEYQAKEIVKSFGVNVPVGVALEDLSDGAVERAVDKVGLPCVIKAQIHAGGRGKGGGVKVAKTKEEARRIANQIMGMRLVTHQTSPEGRLVRRILIEEALPIANEFYLGMAIDRESARVTVMVSEEGGVEIEELAAKTPEKIMKIALDPALGLMPSQARALAFFLRLEGDAHKECARLIGALYKVFVEKDLSLIEINPLARLDSGATLALDCKMNFDSNALYRQKDVVGYRDLDEEDELEIEASKSSLSYIRLDGDIGCMVNGAGLAMATMDIIKLEGGEPANFLDVGGGASEEQIESAFKIIQADRGVKAIFINIFGGILRCDRLATGLVNAARSSGLAIPVVLRMEGTNVELGRKILKESELDFILADSARDGALKAVAAAKGK